MFQKEAMPPWETGSSGIQFCPQSQFNPQQKSHLRWQLSETFYLFSFDHCLG